MKSSGELLSKTILVASRIMVIGFTPSLILSYYRAVEIDGAFGLLATQTLLYLIVLATAFEKVPLKTSGRIITLGIVTAIVAFGALSRNESIGIPFIYIVLSSIILTVVLPKLLRYAYPLLMLSIVTALAISFSYIQITDGLMHLFGVATVSMTIVYFLSSILETTQARFAKETELRIKLDESLSQAQNANLAQADFLANLSHEIRTPLNGIFGSLQIIQENETDLSMVERYTQVAMKSYHSVIGILNDILDLTKIREGKVSLYPQPTRLDDVLGLICSEFGPAANLKGIQLNCQVSERAKNGNRLIDQLRLGQVLRNFVSNAVKFTENGKIEVFADVAENANCIIFTIKDTGLGIPEDKLETIFSPFEQVQPSRITERRGTGLGLSISKRLIEMMAGSITVESTLNKGTTFTLMLELPITNDVIKDSLTDKPIKDSTPARILLAEDIETNQMVFQVMLRNEPYEIETAENGQIAVEKALKNDYDIIFMDIMMPVMGGIEAFHKLRNAGFTKPIVACTGNVMKEDVEQYIAEGFNGAVGKPYLKDELRMHIQSAVSTRL